MRGQRRGQLGGGQDGTWDVAVYHDESPVLRLTGLQNAFNTLPEPYYFYSLEPINGWMGVPLATDHADICMWELPPLPDTFWNSVGGVFLRVLGFSSLTAEERTVFTAFGDDLTSRRQWLMPRVAAKEAVRYLTYTLTNERHYSADIALHQNPDGTYVAHLPGAVEDDRITVVVGISESGALVAQANWPVTDEIGQQNAATTELETNV